MELVQEWYGISERRAYRALSQPRATQRYSVTIADDEEALTRALVQLASRYGRYGCRRVSALLRRDGWRVNHKRVERIWRLELMERYGIPLSRELHACDLLAGRGLLAKNGTTSERVSAAQGASVFLEGLCRLEDAARRMGGIEVINVCLHKPESRRYEQASLDRLLNRINTSVTAVDRHAFLIFDEGKEQMITRLYGRLKVRNHVPSRYDLWEDGEKTRNIPIEQVIGGPAFRSSKDDYLLQMADFIAHALLKQEEAPVPRVEDMGINGAFCILDKTLNRQASRRDPQGVVRG